MSSDQAAWAIRQALGEFLCELAFIDRRWIRLDSCSNKTCVHPTTKKEVACPIKPFSDLLGVSENKANDYLRAAKLLVVPKRGSKLNASRNDWEMLAGQYRLDIEVTKVSMEKYIGKKVWVLRIGSLCVGLPLVLSVTRLYGIGGREQSLRVSGL